MFIEHTERIIVSLVIETVNVKFYMDSILKKSLYS